MAKKQVKIYLMDECATWAELNPLKDNLTSTVTLLTEWAFLQVTRGAIAAVGRLSDEERLAVTAYAVDVVVTPVFSPAMLAAGMSDWFSFGEGADWGWNEEKKNKLVETCKNMTAAEVLGLLAFVKGEGANLAADEPEELYTFHDYIVDRKLLAKGEPTLQDMRVLWDVWGDDYKEYCEDNGYDSEDLGEF